MGTSINRYSGLAPESSAWIELDSRIRGNDENRIDRSALSMVVAFRGLMVIGRFAPTPSGGLHFGSLVAALASFLSARRQGGRWLVRMEDVDTPRCEPGADAQILHQLELYALHWDGEVIYQSTRSQAYRAALDDLLAAGLAYVCRCSRTQIRHSATRSNSEGAIYPGSCRALGLPVAVGLAVRLDVEAAQAGRLIAFVDGAYGAMDVAQDWGDFVLWRVEDMAAYHLAVVVDDAAQGVSEVVRGVDLLDSTARQILLQRVLALPTPRYTHVPLALAANGQKLSKQNRAPCLPIKSAAQDLWDALVFLGEQPPLELRGAEPEVLLAWALGQPIDSAKLIHETVGCAMRTDRLEGAHGAPYGLTDNHG